MRRWLTVAACAVFAAACQGGSTVMTPGSASHLLSGSSVIDAELSTLLFEAAGGKLTPDQALEAITRTARPLAGYGKWEVGAGYLDVKAAVDYVRHPKKRNG